MSYADKIRVASFDLKTADMAGTPADNADLFAILIPANREVEIYGFQGLVRLAGAASSKMELCDASSNLLAAISVASTGVQKDTTRTFPIRYKAGTSDTYLKLRVDGTLDATTDVTFEVLLSEPFKA